MLEWTLGNAELGNDVLELGAGPGRVTPMLLSRTTRVTSVDPDLPALARLCARTPHAAAVGGDACELPFVDRHFSAVAAFTMLHHVATCEHQDRLLREARRVLRPGGCFVGCDPLDGTVMRLLHVGGTFVPTTPDRLSGALRAAGFGDIEIAVRGGYLRWSACRP